MLQEIKNKRGVSSNGNKRPKHSSSKLRTYTYVQVIKLRLGGPYAVLLASVLRRAPTIRSAPLETMAFRARLRTLAPGASRAALRQFHSTPRAFVKVGDPVPDLDVLVEGSPGNKVNLATEFEKGDGLIIGVPGAFSGACSAKHVPSYINHAKLKDAGKVFVVSVNDAFVMKAWGEALDPAKKSGVR